MSSSTFDRPFSIDLLPRFTIDLSMTQAIDPEFSSLRVQHKSQVAKDIWHFKLVHPEGHALRATPSVSFQLDGDLAKTCFRWIIAKRVIAALACGGLYGDVRACFEGGQILAIGVNQLEVPNVFGHLAFVLHQQRRKFWVNRLGH